MKREAYRHPKMLDLASRLNIDRARAIGIVTLLLDFTADMATQGDIGKWSDGAIARACEWGTLSQDTSHDASAFVLALIESGWLDRGKTCRLLVHDWPIHCERFVKSKLATLGLDFHPDYANHAVKAASRDASQDVSRDVSADPPRDQTKPNQTKPKPNPKEAEAAVAALPLEPPLDGDSFREAWSVWLKHRRQIRKPLTEVQALEQLSQFARWGPERSIAAIRFTVRQGWQGLREPESQATKSGKDYTP